MRAIARARCAPVKAAPSSGWGGRVNGGGKTALRFMRRINRLQTHFLADAITSFE
jgi:hypothetical protein